MRVDCFDLLFDMKMWQHMWTCLHVTVEKENMFSDTKMIQPTFDLLKKWFTQKKNCPKCSSESQITSINILKKDK